jgi:Flp pilus assembly protein TadB
MEVMQAIATWTCFALGLAALIGSACLAWCWCIDRVVSWLRVNVVLMKFIVAVVRRRMKSGEALEQAIKQVAKEQCEKCPRPQTPDVCIFDGQEKP